MQEPPAIHADDLMRVVQFTGIDALLEVSLVCRAWHTKLGTHWETPRLRWLQHALSMFSPFYGVTPSNVWWTLLTQPCRPNSTDRAGAADLAWADRWLAMWTVSFENALIQWTARKMLFITCATNWGAFVWVLERMGWWTAYAVPPLRDALESHGIVVSELLGYMTCEWCSVERLAAACDALDIHRNDMFPYYGRPDGDEDAQCYSPIGAAAGNGRRDALIYYHERYDLDVVERHPSIATAFIDSMLYAWYECASWFATYLPNAIDLASEVAGHIAVIATDDDLPSRGESRKMLHVQEIVFLLDLFPTLTAAHFLAPHIEALGRYGDADCLRLLESRLGLAAPNL